MLEARALVVVHVLWLLTSLPGCQHATDQPTEPTDARDQVRTVELRLEVENARTAASSARELATSHGAYVDSGVLQSANASLTFRVPTRELESLRQALRELGTLQHEEERSQDVTAQRADVGARLRAARVEEERLLTLLSEGTGSLTDVLTVEARLGMVRERVEQLDAHARTLASGVDLTALHVTLRERPTPFWQEPLMTLRDAGTFGVDAAAAVTVGAGAVLAGAGPTLLLLIVALGLVLLPMRVLARRRA